MSNKVERLQTGEMLNLPKEAPSGENLQNLVVEMRDGALDVVVAIGNVSEAARATAAQTMGEAGQSTGGSSGMQSRKQQVQLKIARVQAMSSEALRSGIQQEMNHEINALYSKAKSMNRWFTHKFSAYELNQIMTRIRKLREQLTELVKLGLEKLRELYITLVLKLQVVKA